jgi:two-component system, cell cycle response regulator
MLSENLNETWAATSPMQLISGGNLEACLVHIYPTGPQMGKRYALGNRGWVLGRADTCDISLDENSVSRRHAKIDPSQFGYIVQDLGSTNGTFVNDVVVNGIYQLKDGDYLRVGNCIYRFLAGGNIESEYHEEIYRLTIMDGLTQIHNQRYLLDFLERELARSVRHFRPLSAMMIDLDRFKSINDEYGHLTGDYVLRELSDRIRHSVRREDLFARYGGEEFCLVLVETQLEAALEVAEKIRLAVCEKPFRHEGKELWASVSIGVAMTQGESILTPAELLSVADTNLYEAKHRGRNQVVA